jgi:micrococcal nuclease
VPRMESRKAENVHDSGNPPGPPSGVIALIARWVALGVIRSRPRLPYAMGEMDPTRPEWQIGPPRHRPRTLWSDLAGLWHRFRGVPVAAQLIGVAVAILVVIAIATLLTGSDDGTTVASRSSTTRRGTVPVATTTTLPPLPPGDDKAIKGVIDGDSFETLDGVKVRLIGIDAPDVETSDCFSAEATSHLRELLPPGRAVRLVYDESTTDRFGRTLAYVYRHPDGMFVNLAVARDGFAIQQTAAPNTRHADEFGAAVAEARAAERGLWKTCSTTTTAGRSATTAATSATTAPATTEPETTTTTGPESTSTSTPSAGSTTSTR